ncbi:HupE/UreJ family protein [Haloflavibacter putidus]|uniref:HupE/UreJ family protein n=1 Tax=Haloflavibacter putidus TaxID=2576776 RepID=A0A507ZJT9_9FLAO|nr:HupE/UreJ family protein [Haloflavibacter putidus]TQD36951.1 HupE/UreJ family protein [Haloflavibacter putidus]
MNDFSIYFNLGLTHVLDWNAYDHVLFLTVLVAASTFKDWKRVVGLVTLFTIGHTASLVLAAYDVLAVSGSLIEFLIPVSILITAFYNLFTAGKTKNGSILLLYVVTLFFGLIHGFGFSSFFVSTTGSGGIEVLRLLAFAVGIEAAQLIVVLIVLLLAFIFQNIFRLSKRDWVLIISAIIIGLTIPMLRENWIL